MSRCIQCGREDAEDRLYACVRTESEIVAKPGEKHRTRVLRETVTEVFREAVCTDCARKKKLRAVLMTLPITLLSVPVMAVLSLFSVRPNRNIRSEISDFPITLPIVAVIFWACGLSVYLPIPRDMFMTDIIRKHRSLAPDLILVPLDRRALTRRKDGPVKASDIRRRRPVKTELAEKLASLIEENTGEAGAQALVGQTFTAEELAR